VIISFVVPVKNDARRLDRCLESIAAAARGHEYEVIVVDNGSTDDTVNVARRSDARVLVIPDKRVPELRNAGARIAEGAFIAFVDADHEIVPGWLPAALEVFASSDVAGAGSLYTAPPTATWVQRAYGALRGRTVGTADARWLGSGNLIVRREVFHALGGFDPSLDSCEDVDFCQRLRRAGWRLIADERLASIHHGDPATLSALFSAERWRGRNNLRVSVRNGLTWHDLPSVAAPLLLLAGLVLAMVSAIGAAFLGARALWGVAPAMMLGAALVLLRAARIVRSAGSWSLQTVASALAVGATYEVARAVAIVSSADHHRERAGHPQIAPSR